MPTINHADVLSGNQLNSMTLKKWTPLAGTDVGEALEIPLHSDKTVHIFGTFDSATVVLQGTLDGTNWATLTDPQGNAISKTAAAIETITENTLQIRPSVSGGGGTCAITVIVLARGNTYEH